MTLEQRSDSAAAGHEACDQPIRSLEILNQCVPLFETLKDRTGSSAGAIGVPWAADGGELAESLALSARPCPITSNCWNKPDSSKSAKTPPAAFARCVRIDGCRCSMNCLPP